MGVAFASLTSGENIGYVIPSTVVNFFLRGYETTGTFPGLCSLGVRIQNTQSPGLRRLHGLEGGIADKEMSGRELRSPVQTGDRQGYSE